MVQQVKDLALSLMWPRSRLFAWVPSMALELLHAAGVAKKNKTKQKQKQKQKKRDFIYSVQYSCFVVTFIIPTCTYENHDLR